MDTYTKIQLQMVDRTMKRFNAIESLLESLLVVARTYLPI